MHLGSNPSLAATDFCPVVLLSWRHADSFLALILSGNSCVASVALLIPKYRGSWLISILFFQVVAVAGGLLPLHIVARKSSTC